MIEKIESFVAKRYSANVAGEDCSACRMVSGFGLIGMGIYVLTAAKKQKTVMSRNFVYLMSAGKVNKYCTNSEQILIYNFIFINLFLFRTGVVGLGAARILALPPFEHKTSD